MPALVVRTADGHIPVQAGDLPHTAFLHVFVFVRTFLPLPVLAVHATQHQRAPAPLGRDAIGSHMDDRLHHRCLPQFAWLHPRAAGLQECFNARLADVHALLCIFDACHRAGRKQRSGLRGHALADVMPPHLLQAFDGLAVFDEVHLALQGSELRLQDLQPALLGDQPAVGNDRLGGLHTQCGKRSSPQAQQDCLLHGFRACW